MRSLFLVCFLAMLACSSSSSSSPTVAPTAGNIGPKVPPSPLCLTDPCASDTDCGAGSRCNTSLATPTCQKVHCGDAATICSTEEVCKTGMQCHEEQCNPCTFCGDLCEVDFTSDPKNCGACGVVVPKGKSCVDGAVSLVCPEGKTPCGDTCVDLMTDPAHCGKCDQQIDEASVQCVGGKAVSKCKAGQRTCPGKACADPFSSTNCGVSCDTPRACTGAERCVVQGYGKAEELFRCMLLVKSTNRQTCASICAAQGLSCLDGGVYFDADAASIPDDIAVANYASGPTTYEGTSVTCAGVPPATFKTFPFSNVECLCGH